MKEIQAGGCPVACSLGSRGRPRSPLWSSPSPFGGFVLPGHRVGFGVQLSSNFSGTPDVWPSSGRAGRTLAGCGGATLPPLWGPGPPAAPASGHPELYAPRVWSAIQPSLSAPPRRRVKPQGPSSLPETPQGTGAGPCHQVTSSPCDSAPSRHRR